MEYKVATKLPLEQLETYINAWNISEGWKLTSLTYAQPNYVTVVLENERNEA
jgi:hypothetical protein